MESSVLNYPTSFITSLVLKNKDLSPIRLNEIYPSIDEIVFTKNRKSLERLGLVPEITIKGVNNLYDKVVKSNNRLDNDKTEFTNDEVRAIIEDNITLLPKQLNALYPTISSARFNGIRHYLPEITIERCRKNYYKSVEKYKDKGFEGKNLIRDFVAKTVAESGVYGLIGCLPHFDWLGEVAIDNLCVGNEYVGVANNNYVFKGADIKKDLLGLNATMEYGDMLDMISKYSSNSFAHLNMDFCGVMPKQAETVVYGIENDLVRVGGYMFLTFKRVVRKVKYGYYSELFNMYKTFNRPETGLTDSDFANDKLLEYIVGDKFEIVKKIPYQTGSSMVFYAIKRIK